MEVAQVLRMNGGTSDTSYASNSLLQRKVLSIVQPITEEAMVACYSKYSGESIGVAELGCSSGPNALVVASQMVEAIGRKCKELGRPPPPELRLYLNDLPGNDFNTLFKLLPPFHARYDPLANDSISPLLYVSGVPGSFYGRLFPRSSLHFVHSSYSLMWLSQVPPELSETGNIRNRGNISISKTSPPAVFKAYLNQFQSDFFKFLRLRSVEMIASGRMVLTLIGRKNDDPSTADSCDVYRLMAKALDDMVLEGIIDERRLNGFNIPLYTASPTEVRATIEAEGSFVIHRLETHSVCWDPEGEGEGEVMNVANADAGAHFHNKDSSKWKRGERVAKYMRAIAEPMLATHFGDAIMDDLFCRYKAHLADHMEQYDAKYTNLVISMEKK